MVDFNNSLFNVVQAGQRIATRVLGSDLTGIIATLAQGLFKNGDIDIDANGSVDRVVAIHNSGTGVAAVTIDGSLDVGQGIHANIVTTDTNLNFYNGANTLTITGTPSASNNVVTIPDITGDALARKTSTGVVDLIGDTRFNAPDSGADTSVGFFNSGVGRVCNVVAEGTMQFLTDLGTGAGFRFAGTPTALRTITCPDADITLSSGGSSVIPVATNAAIHALPVPAGPVIYLCSDIGGIAGGGVTGALVYWNSVTGIWLRIANDSPF